MHDEIKHWILRVVHGRSTAETGQGHDLPPLEIEKWVNDGKLGMKKRDARQPTRSSQAVWETTDGSA